MLSYVMMTVKKKQVVFDSEIICAPYNNITTSQMDLMPNVDIKSLNVKQTQIMEVVNKWARSYVNNLSSEQRTEIKPLHTFITGDAGCGKSDLIRTIHASMSNTLSYRSAYTEKTKVLLVPTCVAAINVSGTTFRFKYGSCMPTTKLYPSL